MRMMMMMMMTSWIVDLSLYQDFHSKTKAIYFERGLVARGGFVVGVCLYSLQNRPLKHGPGWNQTLKDGDVTVRLWTTFFNVIFRINPVTRKIIVLAARNGPETYRWNKARRGKTRDAERVVNYNSLISDIPVFKIISVLVCIKFNINHLSINFYTVIITISVSVLFASYNPYN